MNNIDTKIFADRLKEYRIQKGLTQKEFSENIAITAAALSAYENNQKNPSVSVIKRIGEFYGVSLDWLCGLSEQQERKASIENYADMFRLILQICDIKNSNGEWKVLWDSDPFDKNKDTRSSLMCEDPQVSDFFRKWQEILKLYRDHTIDKHLYQLWLSDQLKYYQDKKISADEIPDQDAITPDTEE